jgi:hypothetical protein
MLRDDGVSEASELLKDTAKYHSVLTIADELGSIKEKTE